MQPQGKLGLYPPCTVCHPSPPYTGLLQRAAVTVTHLCPSLAPRKSRGKWTWGIWGKAHLVVLLPCPSSRAAHQHLHEGRAIVSNLHFVYLLLLLQLQRESPLSAPALPRGSLWDLRLGEIPSEPPWLLAMATLWQRGPRPSGATMSPAAQGEAQSGSSKNILWMHKAPHLLPRLLLTLPCSPPW